MKSIKYILLLIVMPAMLLNAQSHVRFNNYWDNMYNLNPASIDDSYLGIVSMGARKQWVNFDGAPSTIFAMGTLYLEDISTQLGMKVFNEKKGYTNSIDLDFSYTHTLMIRNYWKLNLGLSVSYQNFSFDISKVTFASIENPDIYDRLMSSNEINADFGFEFNNQNWKLGGSSHNLKSILLPKNELHINTNILYALFRQNNNDAINYGFGVNAFQYGDIFQMEFNLSTFIKKNYNSSPIQIGVFYRTWHELGLIFGVELDKFKVSYSCDYNFGKIMYHSYGTHEVILSFRFNKSYHCRTCW